MREKADYADAEKICSEILSIKGLAADVASSAMLVKASCLELSGGANGSKKAVEVYEKLRKDYPSTDAAQISYINEARVEASAGRYSEARKLCLTLCEKYPKGKFAYAALFDAARYAAK